MKSTPLTWTQTFLSHLHVSRWTSFLTSKKSKINRCQYMIWTLVSSNSSKKGVSIYKWNSARTTNDFTLWKSWHKWSHCLRRNFQLIEIRPRIINTFYCHLKNIEPNFTGLIKKIDGSTLVQVDLGFCSQKMG